MTLTHPVSIAITTASHTAAAPGQSRPAATASGTTPGRPRSHAVARGPAMEAPRGAAPAVDTALSRSDTRHHRSNQPHRRRPGQKPAGRDRLRHHNGLPARPHRNPRSRLWTHREVQHLQRTQPSHATAPVITAATSRAAAAPGRSRPAATSASTTPGCSRGHPVTRRAGHGSTARCSACSGHSPVTLGHPSSPQQPAAPPPPRAGAGRPRPPSAPPRAAREAIP